MSSYERRFVDEFLLTAVLGQPSDNRLETYLLKGHAGSGKSIALRRAAWNGAVDHNAFTFWLNRGAQIDVDFVRQLYNLTEERIYIFIEDALHVLRNIHAISNVFRTELIPVTLVFGARTNEWNIADDVHDLILTDSFELSDLNDREIDQLLLRLTTHRCLGHLTTLNDDERRDHFRLTAQRQLLVALHEATFGKTFEEIVLDEYMNVVPSEAQSLYLDVATFHRFRVSLRAGLVSRVSGINLEYFSSKLFGPLEHVVKVVYDWRSRDYAYETRHSVIADLVCRQVLTDPEDRAEQIIRLVRLMNVDYQSDNVAFEHLIRGRDLADLFDDRIFVDRIFRAASEAAANKSHIAHQRAVFELNHPSGNARMALDALQLAENESDSSRGRASIRHTRALALRKLALGVENRLQKDKFRGEAKEILRRLIRRGRPSAHSPHALCLVLLDDLKDRLEAVAYAHNSDFEILERKIGLLIRETEKVIQQGLQNFPADRYLLSSESEMARLLDDAPRATQVLERALEANPGDGFISLRVARLYRNRGDVDDAKRILVQCLECNPTDRGVHVELAQFLRKEDEYRHRDEIRSHLRRGFTPGDTNYDAQFWYARHEFLYGDISLSNDTFSTLGRANISPEIRQNPRVMVVDLDGAPIRFPGNVRNRERVIVLSHRRTFQTMYLYTGILFWKIAGNKLWKRLRLNLR